MGGPAETIRSRRGAIGIHESCRARCALREADHALNLQLEFAIVCCGGTNVLLALRWSQRQRFVKQFFSALETLGFHGATIHRKGPKSAIRGAKPNL